MCTNFSSEATGPAICRLRLSARAQVDADLNYQAIVCFACSLLPGLFAFVCQLPKFATCSGRQYFFSRAACGGTLLRAGPFRQTSDVTAPESSSDIIAETGCRLPVGPYCTVNRQHNAANGQWGRRRRSITQVMSIRATVKAQQANYGCRPCCHLKRWCS